MPIRPSLLPQLDEQRRVTMYLEATEPLTPMRTLHVNSVYITHSILYRCHLLCGLAADWLRNSRRVAVDWLRGGVLWYGVAR